MPRRNKIRVVEKRYLYEKGRRALAICYQFRNLIEIDPDQTAFSYLDSMIHEHMHMFFPEIVETRIKNAASKVARALWNKNYRRIAK